MAASLPDWVASLFAVTRRSRTPIEGDEFSGDVSALLETALPYDTVEFLQVDTTASAIELAYERRTGRWALFWDVDCLRRLDGMLALLLCEADRGDEFQGLGLRAFAHQAASTFLHSDPVTAMQILRLAAVAEPQESSLTIEDEACFDRYRRAMRMYIALHEMGHVVFRSLPDRRAGIDAMVEETIRRFEATQERAFSRTPSPLTARLRLTGMLVPQSEVALATRQAQADVASPLGGEEVWCDMFACQHLLSWARGNGISPAECCSVEATLHRFFSGRLQWQCFWSQSNRLSQWSDHPALKMQESRANIRGLFMVESAFADWAENEGKGGSVEDFRTTLAEEGDLLTERFFDRNHLALGVFSALDRQDVFLQRRLDWEDLGREGQHVAVEEMFEELT